MRRQQRPRARNQRVSSFRQRRQQHLLDVKVRSRKAVQYRNRKFLVVFSKIALVIALIACVYVGARVAAKRFFIDNPEQAGKDLHDVAPDTVADVNVTEIIAFGVSALRRGDDAAGRRARFYEAPPLAPAALRLAAALAPASWRAASLSAPIYARPPATTAPKPRPESPPP